MAQLGVILLLVSVQVLSRYLATGLKAAGWTEELARTMLIWLTLVASFYLLRTGNHLQVGLVVGLLKGRKRLAMELFSSVVVMLVLVLTLRVAIPLAEASRTELTAALEWPRLVVYGPFVAFGAMMLLFTLVRGALQIRHLLWPR